MTPARTMTPQERVLALQRTAGNRAVARMVARGKLPPGLKAEDGQVPVRGWRDWWNWLSGTPSPAPTTPSPAPAPAVSPPQPAPPPPAVSPSATPATPAPATTPPRLSKRTISGPTAFTCGSCSWVVQWVLDKPTTVGGWVVQHVIETRDVKTATGTDAPADPTGYVPVPFWEAWPINAGQSVTTYAQQGDPDDDTYGALTEPDTRGRVVVVARAEFYEGATLPPDMVPAGKPPAWILPYARSDPRLPGGTGAIPHDLTTSWDCTAGGVDTTQITSSA
jgi:hypothetical protein